MWNVMWARLAANLAHLTFGKVQKGRWMGLDAPQMPKINSKKNKIN